MIIFISWLYLISEQTYRIDRSTTASQKIDVRKSSVAFHWGIGVIWNQTPLYISGGGNLKSGNTLGILKLHLLSVLQIDIPQK